MTRTITRTRRPDGLRAMLLALVLLTTLTVVAAEPPEPTHADVRYSDAHDRSVLDLWLPAGASAEAPAPIVVYFHGGGFKGGDKRRFRSHPMLRRHHDSGVAFASVNYPLLRDMQYLEILAHCELALRYLREHAADYGIDPERLAVMGGSAGAMIAEYLSYWTELPITACYAEQQPHGSQFLLVPVKAPAPPLILYTRSGVDDPVHHPKHARFFKTHFDSLEIPCQLYGSRQSGLPQLPAGTQIDDHVFAFLRQKWGLADAP